MGKGFSEASTNLDDLWPAFSKLMRESADELSDPTGPFAKTVQKAMQGFDANSTAVGSALSSFRQSIDKFMVTAVNQSVDAAKVAHKQEILTAIDKLMKASLDAEAAALSNPGVVAQGKRALFVMLKKYHDLFGG
jgi:hypothetical protein